jgi:hypothetical protein
MDPWFCVAIATRGAAAGRQRVREREEIENLKTVLK